jgi:toxin ParE1/3/4
MVTIRYSASAENDLLEAWLYVAEDSVMAADRLLDQIEIEATSCSISH